MATVAAGNYVYARDYNDLEARIAAAEAAPVGMLVGSSTETSDSGTFTSETQIGAVTFTEISGYVYLIECGVQLASATVTDIVQGTLRENSSAGTERHSGRFPAQTSDQARPIVISLAYLYTAAATGSKTFVATGQRVSGGGNVKREAGTTHPQLFVVRRVA